MIEDGWTDAVDLAAPADEALVAAARNGDKSAFALLVARHRPVVVSVCRRMMGEPQLAEDATQEAVVRALLDLQRLRQPERFGAWLTGIALNVCRQWLRQSSRHPWESLEADRFAGGAREGPIGPEELAEAAEEAATVQDAVAALPAGQRAAVTDFYLRGLTHRELAATLGVSVNAVKARLHKARATLRRRLGGLREEATMTDGTGALAMEVGYLAMPPKRDERAPQSYVVVLREVEGDRLLPIWIGEHEAVALALTLEQVELRRPMAYQLAANLLAAAGADVAGVRLTRLAEGTFYAVVEIDGPRGRREVDARPSDALNLALLTGTPISADAAMLAKAQEAPGCEDWPAVEEAATSDDLTIGADQILVALRGRYPHHRSA